MGIVTGYSQATNSFTVPSVIDICVPPGPNNTYPDADIDVTNVVTITGNVILTNIIDNNVERQPNHSVLQHPVNGQFYGVAMPGNESVPAGTYNISFDPIHDPGPNGRTGTVTFVTSNAGTHQVTVNITRCGSGQQQQTQTQQQAQTQQTSRPTQQQWSILIKRPLTSLLRGRGVTKTLHTRFNPKTGQVEVTKNGIFSQGGFLKTNGGSGISKRLMLRGYR